VTQGGVSPAAGPRGREPVAGEAALVSHPTDRYRMAVRRAAVVVVAAGFWLIVLASAAWAHPGIEDPYVPAHVVTTVALGVPSEQPSPMVEIDVTLPPDFSLHQVDPIPGWQETTTPGQIRYFDGNVPQGGYAQFTFSGVFTKKEVAEVPVITRAADGTTIDWNQSPTERLPAAIMFPGYPVGAAPVPGVVLPGSTTNSGWGPLEVVVGLLILGGGVAFGVTASRRRARRRPRRGVTPRSVTSRGVAAPGVAAPVVPSPVVPSPVVPSPGPAVEPSSGAVG
jgi:hypothetical protein